MEGLFTARPNNWYLRISQELVTEKENIQKRTSD